MEAGRRGGDGSADAARGLSAGSCFHGMLVGVEAQLEALRNASAAAGVGLIRVHREASQAHHSALIAAFETLRERLLMAQEDALSFERRCWSWRQRHEEQALLLHAADRLLCGPGEKARRMLSGDELRRHLVVALPGSTPAGDPRTEILWRCTSGCLAAAHGMGPASVGMAELREADDVASMMRLLEFVDVAARHAPSIGLPALVGSAMRKIQESGVWRVCFAQLVRTLRSVLLYRGEIAASAWDDIDTAAFVLILRGAMEDGAGIRAPHLVSCVLTCCLELIQAPHSPPARDELLVLAHDFIARSLFPICFHLDKLAPHVIRDPVVIADIDASLAAAFRLQASWLPSPDVAPILLLGKRLAPHRARAPDFVRAWVDLLTSFILFLASTGTIAALQSDQPATFKVLTESLHDIPLFLGFLGHDAFVDRSCLLLMRMLTSEPFGGVELRERLVRHAGRAASSAGRDNEAPGVDGSEGMPLSGSPYFIAEEWLNDSLESALREGCPTLLESLCEITGAHQRDSAVLEQLLLLVHHLCRPSIAARMELLETELPGILARLSGDAGDGAGSRVLKQLCALCLERYLTPNGSW